MQQREMHRGRCRAINAKTRSRSVPQSLYAPYLTSQRNPHGKPPDDSLSNAASAVQSSTQPRALTVDRPLLIVHKSANRITWRDWIMGNLMSARVKAPNHAKMHGVHYTPPELAAFLADVTTAAALPVQGPVRVLDPACGDGALLVAMAKALPQDARCSLILEGFDTDGDELAKADAALARLGVADVILHHRDFLSESGVSYREDSPGLFDEKPSHQYDIVIANPPYVRTQVMGANKAQALARRFGLTGRVDLYQAFARAMTCVLKPGGVMGLLTSNRFLTVKSGAALRDMFSSHFEIEAVYDLGDTKLFVAAVLPAIVVGRKVRTRSSTHGEFHRIYENRSEDAGSPAKRPSVLSALGEHELKGLVATPSGTFRIERGKLAIQCEGWALSNSDTNDWLNVVTAQQSATFGDLSKVRVGIKSTADEVFVRDDWESLPADMQPEPELLRPLLTHREAARWLPQPAVKRVVYPQVMERGKRLAVDLDRYPGATAYFELHKPRLSRRTYVLNGGRKWYEIWVPHNPDDWAKPKIAYPDISEHPRFFFDSSGAIIQGDCYWITLNDGVDPDWLPLMLAVANSTFITKYYDTVFHNKLYAGRRRFMTQYVAKFPLPDLAASRTIVNEVSRLLRAGQVAPAEEERINQLVWKAFGLSQGPALQSLKRS
jgi:adenine-specific DNA-methyltransferase